MVQSSWARRRALPVLSALLVLAILLPLLAIPRLRTAAQATRLVYGDALNGFENWSWDTTVNLANTAPVQSGTSSIAVTHTAAWAALFLHIPSAGAPIDVSSYRYLRFYIHGGTGTGTNTIGVKFVTPVDQWGPTVGVRPAAGVWTMVEIPIADLGSPSTIEAIVFQENSGAAQQPYYLDQIELISQATPPTATPVPPTPSGSLSFTINTAQGRRPISPYIYGVNQDLRQNENASARRMGGNRTTGYNWENNASNAGSDWLHTSDNFMCGGVPDCSIPGAVYTNFHDQSLQGGAYSLLTLQMAGYVSKDMAGTVPVSQTAPSIRWDPALFKKNAPFVYPPSTADNAVYMDELVAYLVSKYGSAASATGVKGYSLDNEPALWSHTHPRIHPNQPTAQEVTSRGLELSRAVKAVDPAAEIFGPATYGFGEMNDFQTAPDWPTVKGSYGWFVDYYLAEFKKASDASGRRLLDVFDFHWYPEARGGGRRIVFEDNSSAGSVETQAARLQAPRTLWDPTYREDSWIANCCSTFLPIIPRVQQSIDQYYPGTKIGITEWNYGAEDHVSGGLANADALGIFGKYGVYFATLWQTTNKVDYSGAAFKLYRNYDGNKGRFGDTSVSASTSDIATSSVYAALDSADPTVLHVIVLNKNMTQSVTGSFNIAGGQTYTSARVWGFDGNSSALVERAPIASIGGNTFSYALPPLSAHHFVLRASGTPPTSTNTAIPPTRTNTATRTRTSTSTGVVATRTGTNTATPTSTGIVQTPPRTRTSTRTATGTLPNLLLNGGFELDSNPVDGKPDSWGTNANISRSSAARRSGSYSLRHASTANATYISSQVVSGITAGASYRFSGWTNIPATSDTFTYRLELVWRNSSNSGLRTDVVRTFTAANGGTWAEAAGSYVAPTGATNVVVRMNVSGLAATIYADDFSLTRGTTPPTPTRTGSRPPATATSTSTRAPSATSTGVVPPTATNTRAPSATNTIPVPPSPTPTTGGGEGCSPATAITAPFTYDGTGPRCWQISTVPSYINSWNVSSLTINGVDFTNKYATPSQLPAKINGSWYISYSSSVAWGHFEVR